jgi:hypothetical protein
LEEPPDDAGLQPCNGAARLLFVLTEDRELLLDGLVK